MGIIGSVFYYSSSTAVSVVYPAWMSYKALQSYRSTGAVRVNPTRPDGAPADIAVSHEVIDWLIYWIVFGVMSLVDALIGPVLTAVPLPLSYPFAKLVLLVWLAYFRGSDILFHRFIEPQLNPHRAAISRAVGDASALVAASAGAVSETLKASNAFDRDAMEQHAD